ncbi:MAG: alanine--glyoxylate aminotransferase family protein, partial [Deltaproteobacteria bacterium]|nr:alanine--glyoxylate aminotransferase family protein [Deltaproteobacteria bacterium]
DTLFLVDTVTSLGGMEVKVDEWGIDICYSGTQKCLSVPPGLSPLTISSKAYDVLKKRKTKVNSWYLDLTMLTRYWGKERFYHHTAPISMLFALREGLRIIMDEGVENRYARHKKLGDLLKKEFLDLGFTLFSDPNHSLPMLNAFKFPLKIKEPEMRQRLLSEYDIEVGGGLGKTKGKIWRVGLMGESCRLKNILYLVEAIKEIIAN